MKFFTLDWWRGETERDPHEEYSVHLAGIRGRLPADLLATEESVSLHDARLHKLQCSLAEETVSLSFLDYDGKPITLTYLGVQSLETFSDPLVGLPGPHGYGDLGYYEVEILPTGVFEHRLLFSSGIELVVQFKDFQLALGSPSAARGDGNSN